MKLRSIILISSLFIFNSHYSQDTFSIVAVDSVTGYVGSAGASCVDLDLFPNIEDHFLGELFPGVGAINTQAWYLEGNQDNAALLMNTGNTPDQIITWLEENDFVGSPQLRQYGVVAFVNGSPQAAAFTGTETNDYKGHIVGPNYAIQGNILLGQEVLDNMESDFLNATGDLECRLMAALQGANMVGADTRCADNGTSSLFAFVKVANPNDSPGNPEFVLSVRTNDGDGIEPIDALQSLFNNEGNCPLVNVEAIESFKSHFTIFPNPASGQVQLTSSYSAAVQLRLWDQLGKTIFHDQINHNLSIDVSQFSSGLYTVQIIGGKRSFTSKLVVQ